MTGLHVGVRAMAALILALMLSVSDASTAGAAPPAAPPAKPAPDPNRIICKTEDNFGSHMRQRTCKTAAAWSAQERQVQRVFRDIDHTSAQNMGPPQAMGMSVGQ